jgi:hypothetical protein
MHIEVGSITSSAQCAHDMAGKAARFRVVSGHNAAASMSVAGHAVLSDTPGDCSACACGHADWRMPASLSNLVWPLV